MDEVVQELSKIDNVEELFEVTGEFDIITLVSADDIEEFRDILKNKIMKLKGIKSTVSSIVLKAHKGPKCDAEGFPLWIRGKVINKIYYLVHFCLW